MFSKFFIDRPIFSTVTSLLIVIAGVVSIQNLPVEQYPNLTPPTIVVSAQYPGASAEVLSETVASVLEDKINGVEDMIYMNSVSSSNGNLNITVSFKVGTDPDKALINVNNRVQMANALIPEDVRRYGVTVQKRSPAILEVGSFYSNTDLYDETYLGNYAILNIAEELKRIEGVGNAEVMTGNSYSIRIWLKPDKLYKYKLSTSEVYQAIMAQNSQRAAGKIGQPPMRTVHPDKSYSIVVSGRYKSENQFKDIILRTDKNGNALKLSDVAEIELGAQSYEVESKTQGKRSVPIMVSLSPGANSLNTVALVNKKIEELSKRFPEGTAFKVSYDTTGFVKHSIKEVIKTLAEAMILVFLIVYLFLKRFRTTLIPCLAVPVSIIGAFAGMMLLGFSINTLTLFGLVLAIGIVVDDAIIVIENVERIMHEQKMHVYEATLKAMDEVSGPVIAIVLVLCSVFIPIGFMGGFTGIMYKQFAITIAVSVVISGFVALTLTPSLCNLFLDDSSLKHSNKFFDKFDEIFAKVTEFYISVVRYIATHTKVSLSIFAGIILIVYGLFKITPTSLLPDEDQGIVLSACMMDPSASLKRASNVGESVENILKSDPAVADTIFVAGYDLLSGAPKNNAVTLFAKLKPWEERPGKQLSAKAVVQRLMARAFTLTDAMVIGFTPPPIVGMSTTGGFECYLQSLGDFDAKALESKAREFVLKAATRPELSGVRTTFNASTPQFKLVVDDAKVMSMGVNINELYNTIAATFGSTYVNDFSKLGKNFKVMMQSKDLYRAFPEQLNEVYVKSNKGTMIPVSTFVTLEQTVGPDVVERFNSLPSAKILGNPAPGYTSGQALKAVEEICDEISSHDYAVSWTGSAYQEKEASGSSSYVLLLGILVVFLILAAQYEMWSLPFAVLLAIPFAAFGALIATFLRGYSNDLYFQIAIVTLIGLAAKNAILIIEFAVIFYKKQHMTLLESAISAAKIRFRPIVMTSLAFILGCVPLALSSGAGSASRHSLSTSIIGGMCGATFIAPLFIPLFFILVFKITNKLTGVKYEKINSKN